MPSWRVWYAWKGQTSTMKWITREQVKVDRVACPWLIRNFIDPAAEFVFLPANTDWSQVKDGRVYDVPDCELGHHGEDVSFNSILKQYNLVDPALQLLGEIVRAADSHPAYPHPGGARLRVKGWRNIAEFLALKRNTALLLVALVLAGTGEKLWLGFAPKYLQTLGASILIIGCSTH